MSVFNKNRSKLRKYYQNQKFVLQKAEIFVRNRMEGEPTGHDYFHIERVMENAVQIASSEKNADIFVIKLGSLFHDIADWKFNNDKKLGERITKEFLEKEMVDPKTIEKVLEIVNHISFKGGTNRYQMRSIEGKIVQDADRLDAMGAIGVGRAFAYGGFSKREMYNPQIKPREYKSTVQIKRLPSTTINHFYEKLLLLKNNMNTKTGKKLATKRHKFLKVFLKEFLDEWNGKI